MKNATILLLIVYCFFSCGKDDDGPDNPYGLPNATKVGANTFGCLMNGEPWVAEDNGLFGRDTEATYDEVGVGVSDQYYFNISASYYPSSVFPPPDSAISDLFYMNIKPIYSEGDLDVSQLLRKNAVYNTRLKNIDNSLKIYKIDTLYEENRLYISDLDIENNTISGEFTLRLIRHSTLPDTILVTEGRFDVVYQPD